MENTTKLTLVKAQSFLYKIDVGIPVLLALPWLILSINQAWIYTPISLDPWLYWGYFNNFGSFIHAFPGTYYGTRLPWILPGYAAYKLFTPLVANYVLHLGLYYVTIFSIYFTLKITVNWRAALTTAVIMGFYPFFMAAVGTDYIDGSGIAYFALTILLLTLAVKNVRPSQWTVLIQHNGKTVTTACVTSLWPGILLIFAGGTVAAFIFTNTFLIFLVPVIVVYFFLINRSPQRISLLVSLFFALSGFIIITIALGLINKIAGGSFLFFGPSFYYAWELIGQPNPWLIQGYNWLKNANWLVLPVLIFFTSITTVLIRKITDKQENNAKYLEQNAFSFCYIFIFVIMLIFQLIGQPMLQYTYYASYLIPAMCLAIGTQLNFIFDNLNKWYYYGLLIYFIAIFLLPYLAPFRSIFASNYPVIYPLILFAFSICIVLLIKTRIKIQNWIRILVFFTFVTAGYFTLVGSSFWVNFNEDSSSKQLLLAVAESDRIIKEYDPQVKMRFWYSNDEQQKGVFASVTATRLWGFRLINDKFPVLEKYEVGPGHFADVSIPSGTSIGILSNDENVLEKATKSLSDIGLKVNFKGEEVVSQGPINFKFTFIEVNK